MTLRDFIDNIKYARRGLAIEVQDPWKKLEIEKELNNRHIQYRKGFECGNQRYAYAIISGSKEEIEDFIKWFTKDENYHFYIDKHALFGTKIMCLTK